MEILLILKGGQDNEIYGSETNIAKKNIKDVFQPQVYESISERIQSALDNGETQKFEFAWNFPDGVRHFEASLVVSGLSEVLMFAHDISVRTRLEKMKSDFINRASHELRTPLTGALLMCDLIEESTTEEERQEYWGHLRNELGRQRSLVERLLTVGRLETGSLKLNPEPLELKPILQEAVDTVFPLAKISSIEVEMEIEEGLPNVIGDKGALEQVFTNLLNNAVKFSPSGSKVRMSAGQKNEGVQVFIRDNGVGIPAEDIPHLFEGFFRAQNVIEKGIPGSGVGLYIVRSIIQELGGSVSVDSQLDMGTTFGVWLPAVRE